MTSTGRPGFSTPWGSSGRASTRKTSFARSSRLKMTGGVNSASGEMKEICAVRPGGQPSQATATRWPRAMPARPG